MADSDAPGAPAPTDAPTPAAPVPAAPAAAASTAETGSSLAASDSTAPSGTPGAVVVRKRRLPKFDKLLAPIRRLWQGANDSDSVVPAGTVNRTRHRDPRVLFVDTGNAARSQMAECFARQQGLYAESAGTWPAPAIPQEVIEAMQEKGFDLNGVIPKMLDPARLQAFDRVVLFEARIPDAAREGARIEEWDVWDPVGLPLEGHRLVAGELEKRVARLAKVLKGNQGKAAKAKAPRPPQPVMA